MDYTFILVLLFYKQISDKWEMEYEKAYQEALEYGFKEKEAKEEAKNSIYHDFDISQELQKLMFMGWIHQTTVKKEVEREIRKFVRGLKGKYNLTLDEMNNLHKKLVESVKHFGT